MIVGLRGHKGSGRGTIAAYLMKQHGFERRAFADPLKKSIAATLDIPYHEIDKYKNDQEVYITVSKLWETDGMETERSIKFGTYIKDYAEAWKRVLGEDIWVNQVLPVDGYYAGKKIVIPDIHFPNEASRIHDLGGFVAKVALPGLDRSYVDHTADVDYLLYHTRETRDLYGQIEKMLTSLGTPVSQ